MRSAGARPIRDDHLQRSGNDLHSHRVRERDRFSVQVRGPRAGTDDLDATAGPGGHSGGSMQGAGEQARQEQRRTEDGDAFDDGDVEQTVLQRGQRSDPRVVSVLAGVGHGDDERSPFDGHVVDPDRVVLRLKSPEPLQAYAHVRPHPTSPCSCECFGNPCIKSQSHDADERAIIHRGGVDGFDPQSTACLERGRRLKRKPEVAGEAIAGTSGQDSEGHGRSNEMPRDLVNGPVTAHGIDDLYSRRGGVGNEAGKFLSRTAGRDVVRPVQTVRPNHCLEIVPATGTGACVDQKENAQEKECIR